MCDALSATHFAKKNRRALAFWQIEGVYWEMFGLKTDNNETKCPYA